MFGRKIIAVKLLLALSIKGSSGLRISEFNCSALLNKTQNLVNGHGISECPPWFQLDNQTGACLSGPQLGGIIQQDTLTLGTSVLECNCMTEADGVLSVGPCMYTCVALRGYYQVPCHVSQLQNFTCANFNRYGLLCGQCMDTYALPVYSYELKCVKCVDYKYNWLKYLAAAFLPLTIFYILVALFSISFTSPLLSAVVTLFQILANPNQLRIILSLADEGIIIVPQKLVMIIASTAALCNLDFFRMYYTFCLNPDVSPMVIMALDYATAVYPLLLIGATYVMVTLYDHKFKPLVWSWKLCGLILKPLRRRWNITTSLVDVFASFIFLSSNRLLLASMNFLIPITVYMRNNGHSQLTTKRYLMNAPTVEYLGKEHIPLAILAITLSLLLFAVPMVLLFVYPFQWFQRILNKMGCNSVILRTFIEVFQGPFKDGTNGTNDYRSFSGFLLLLPLVQNIVISQTLSSFYYPIISIFILIYLSLLLAFRPYKNRIHNYITIGMMSALLGAFYGSIIQTTVEPVTTGEIRGFWVLSVILLGVSLSSPFLYLLCLACTCAR